jgi:hypothetical protein
MNQPTYKKSFPGVQLGETTGKVPTYKEMSEPLCKNKDIQARQRLNAAAPELLEALEKLVKYAYSMDGFSKSQAIRNAQSAIKKAKGE